MTVLGLVLLVVGAVIAASETHNPTHGVAGGMGVLTMAVGVVLAISGAGAGLALGLARGVVLAGLGAGAVTVTVKQGAAVRRRRVRTGAEGLVGHMGVVRNWVDSTGSVSLDGAVWQARRSACPDQESETTLHAGDRVVVERLSGLTVSVRPAEDWELI
jgi:membrane-bound serine protease (ClpP class)